MMDLAKKPHERIKLVEINPHLTCYLCKGYYIDATTISECLHSFCRSCIIKFLQDNSYCPICEVIINKAKPNLKLDKTLQDIVYKLVPELFLNEMRRRQRFYQSHPDLAAKVTPEERGEDTERTIFNPRDTISLSIEYISDDSTPGAILIPQLIDKGMDVNNKNNSQAGDNEENSAIKRFLQCPGMCRVEVLKKFIRNKYNVDTNQYFIDILYKRVPLPDHYTLIDIAYIYSWKRNEPLKFFFKITDINLVTDSFDYLIRPQLNQPKFEKPSRTQNVEKRPARTSKTHHEKDNKETSNVKVESQKKEVETDIIIKAKDTIDADTLGKDKRKEYTNITLDRSNNLEIITKIQKVSNKNGLQIGIKITKQTVKKSALSKQNGIKSCNTESNSKGALKSSPKAAELPPPKPATPTLSEIDPEKSNFLKSIELTAKNVIQAMSPQKLDLPLKVELPKKESSAKRKNSSPIKAERPIKKPRKYVNIQPKSLQNPAVLQMVSNVNQNASTMSKIVDQATPNASKSKDLQALLFDSYKINIPASLSVTVKSEKDGPTPSTIQKPVQNYIEILKIPDTPATSNSMKSFDIKEQATLNLLDKLNSSVEVSKIEVKVENTCEKGETTQLSHLPVVPKVEQTVDAEGVKQEACDIKQEKTTFFSKLSPTTNSSSTPQLVASKSLKNIPQAKTPTRLPSPAYLPCKVTNMPTRDNFIKLNPRTPQTFQKMFEEAIKKPEFNSKFQTLTVTKSEAPASTPTKPGQKNALNLSISDTPITGKRNILEIASKLYKKTKMEQEKGSHDGETKDSKVQILESTKSSTKPLSVPRPNQHKIRKSADRGNPPLKDFNSYISSKSQPQVVTSLHSPSLGLNYTVSVAQTTPSSNLLSKSPYNPDISKQNGAKLEVDVRCSPSPSPKANLVSPRQPIVSPRIPEITTLNIPRKYSTSPKPSTLSPQATRQACPKETATASPGSKVTSPSKKGSSPAQKLASPAASKSNLNVVTSSHSENSQPLSPNQILEKYNIQNLAQLTANFNFPSNLCMSSAANQLAAIHQAMIYRHFEMQNHQNWMNMNPGPLMQYEKYLQSLSKS